MTTKVVYFTVFGLEEQAEFRSDDNPEDVKEIFRASAEAGPNDILKLYNKAGSLINISASLRENTPKTRYRLDVVASQCTGMLIAEEFGIDFNELDDRITTLERGISVDGGQLPKAVIEMKDKVENFRQKLESVEHLSWLGLFKNMSTGNSFQAFTDWKKRGEEKLAEYHRKVLDRFLKMSHVQVSDEVREYLRKPTFDNWQWDEAEMLILLQQMFLDLKLPQKFNIEQEVLQRWLYEIYMHYNHVPFHNFKHCFMVTQMMYGLISLIDLPSKVEEIDILVLLVSAICHDLDHPGYNNAYQINARTELALLYNDISPLENHHCAVAFDILKQREFNIFRNLPIETFRKIREGMIKCILATDMAKHSEILNNFRAISDDFDIKKKEHKTLFMMVIMKVSDISNEARPMEVAEPWIDCLLQEFFNQLLMILIKTADISNEVRPSEVADPWVECLLQEFFIQSDMEKLEGLPVAPFMDREKVNKPTSQVGFIKFVLLPLFEMVGNLFPSIEDDIIGPVRKALDHYSNMQKAYEGEQRRKSSISIDNSNNSSNSSNSSSSSSIVISGDMSPVIGKTKASPKLQSTPSKS